MVTYQPFYDTLFRKGLTEYYLINKQGFSAHILYRMRHGMNVTVETLDALCSILECDFCDIISHIPDE